jgi:hypothetical protein
VGSIQYPHKARASLCKEKVQGQSQQACWEERSILFSHSSTRPRGKVKSVLLCPGQLETVAGSVLDDPVIHQIPALRLSHPRRKCRRLGVPLCFCCELSVQQGQAKACPVEGQERGLPAQEAQG